MFLMCGVFRPSTRLVLAMNSMDVGRREKARGVIDTAARYTVAGKAWDRADRRTCIDRGIGHPISVASESEMYGFGNGGLLKSTERVTVPVVLADNPPLLSHCVVQSPVLSLLIGRDVVEGLRLDIKGSSKTLEFNGRLKPLGDSVARHYCVTLSPERYDLVRHPASCAHVPHHLSRGAKSQNSRRRWKFVLLCAVVRSVDGFSPYRTPKADVFDSDQRVVLQTARDASWQDPLTRLGLSVTPLGEQLEAPTALQDQQWRCMRK